MIQDIIAYYPPHEQIGVPVKIVRETPDGIKLRRLRIFRGKNKNGFAVALLPDPAYYNVDGWTQKWGLPPLEFCPNKWLDQNLATFKKARLLIPSHPTPQVIWDIYKHAARARKQAQSLLNEAKDIRSNYTPEQEEATSKTSNSINAKVLMNTAKTLPSGVEITQIAKSEVFSITRGLKVAADLFETQINQTNEDPRQMGNAIFERETALQEHIYKNLTPPPDWDGICEIIEPPSGFRNLLNHNAGYWNKLDDKTKTFWDTIVKACDCP